MDDAEESVAILDADGGWVRSGSAVLPIYSLTKTFIAASTLACGIDLQSPLSHWIDATLLPRARDISVAQLLCHSSGIRDYSSPSSPYAAAVAAQASVWDDATFARHTLQQPLEFAPGTRFSYSNPGYWLLGQILQRATGQSLAEVIQQQICQPLGLTSVSLAEGQFARELPRYPAGWVWHGLLLASASDVASFMASRLVRPLRSPLTAVNLTDQQKATSGWQEPNYGYGLMVEAAGSQQRFGHNGEGPGFSAACYHFPARSRTICVLQRGNTEEAAMREVLRLASEH